MLTVKPGSLTDEWGGDVATSVSSSVSGGSIAFTGTAFGDTAVDFFQKSVVGNVLFFQSHLWDADAAQLHMKARVLDPSTGHFLQRDPVAYGDGSLGLSHRLLGLSQAATGPALPDLVSDAAFSFVGSPTWSRVSLPRFCGHPR